MVQLVIIENVNYGYSENWETPVSISAYSWRTGFDLLVFQVFTEAESTLSAQRWGMGPRPILDGDSKSESLRVSVAILNSFTW